MIGVLALQGAFQSHQQRLVELGALDASGPDATRSRRRRRARHAGRRVDDDVEAARSSSELFDPLAERLDDGLPVFGTCAGMILLATEILDGRPDQRSFGAIDIAVQRNGYGRQLDSFETELARRSVSAPTRPRSTACSSVRRR